MNKTGFTIVELLVVIVVIGILASITTVVYLGSIEDADDTKIRSTVKISGDAIQLHEMQNNTTLSGVGLFNATNGVDGLVPSYLKTGYRSGVRSKNSENELAVFKFYRCTGNPGGFVIYASLNRPTSDEVAKVTSTKTLCGQNDSQVPVTGTTKYNYAQIF